MTSTPVSMLATTVPCPRYPSAHIAGALITSRLGPYPVHDEGDCAPPICAGGALGPASTAFGAMRSTSGRDASSSITSAVAVTASPLKIQK